MSTEPKRCFVIMPFSQTSEEHTQDYWEKHFESFLKPLIKESGEIEVFRSEALRGDIIKQIIRDLHNCTIVVADLTDKNANVFWELGVRQSCRHGTITIAQEGTEIPFDISTKGTLYYYPSDHVKNERFRIRFKKAVADCLLHPDNPDSLVLETIPSLQPAHLSPPIVCNVLPVYLDERNNPRAGFIIINLGHLAVKAKVTVRAFLGRKDMGLIGSSKKPYYSGKLLWNLNPNMQFRGNFALKKEWLESTDPLMLEVQVTTFLEGRTHKRLPWCYTYVRNKNYWYTEPTSFDEIRRFIG